MQSQLFDHVPPEPDHRRGAADLIYSVTDGLICIFYAFNGDGESPPDYDRSVTHVGVRISTAR